MNRIERDSRHQQERSQAQPAITGLVCLFLYVNEYIFRMPLSVVGCAVNPAAGLACHLQAAGGSSLGFGLRFQ